MDRFFKSVMMLAFLVVIGCMAFIGYRVFMGDSGNPLPPLTHRSVVEAMSELERMGLKARVESQRSSLPQGTVIAQTPRPGVKVRPESLVVLTVSGGTSKVQLPELRGLTVDEATRQIKEAGFRLGDQLMVTSQKPAGTVVAQEPSAPGQVPLTEPISLMVSIGSKESAGSVVVPDMVQKQYDEAKALLESSGLKAESQAEYTTQTPAGMVMAMSPRAGASVPKGTRIMLTVASQNQADAVVPVEPVNNADGSTTEQPAASVPADGQDQAGASDVTAGDQVTEEAPQVVIPSNPTQTADQTPATPTTSAEQPAKERPVASQPQGKVAKVRYQVPPVNDMTVRVEMTDGNGTRELLKRKAKANEQIRLEVPYQGTAVVTVYLDDEFVWQDRYK